MLDICLSFININIFHHLKLEIALAIPASNEWKILANNTGGQELSSKLNNLDLYTLATHNLKWVKLLDYALLIQTI